MKIYEEQYTASEKVLKLERKGWKQLYFEMSSYREGNVLKVYLVNSTDYHLCQCRSELVSECKTPFKFKSFFSEV